LVALNTKIFGDCIIFFAEEQPEKITIKKSELTLNALPII
jgi:hypothetical protein